MEVPYKPFYAFEEILATFGDDPGSPASLLSSFERITDSVTGGKITSMRPIAEDLRLQYKEIFARRQPSVLTQVYLSYAPEDRMWADWIEAVLTRAGFRVIPRSTMATAPTAQPGSPGRTRAPERPAGDRRAVVRLHALTGGQIGLESPGGRGRGRHPPAVRADPGQ